MADMDAATYTLPPSCFLEPLVRALANILRCQGPVIVLETSLMMWVHPDSNVSICVCSAAGLQPFAMAAAAAVAAVT
jgi:hypothetical protein